MKRVVILGASGFFGRLIAERLRAAGLQPILASRWRSEVRIDANDREQIRANLKARDLVIDTAGPFQTRTTTLIESARTIGFDVIDLSDSPEYTKKIYDLEAPIGAAGIRVLTACSALSAVSAAVVKSVGVTDPRRVSAYLVPATRYTANPATTQSMLMSLIGKPRTIRFPRPLGTRSGFTVKSVDVVTLPRVFPSVRTAELIVDTKVPGANALLKLFGLWPGFRRAMEGYEHVAIAIARRIGPKHGVLAYEISAPLMQKYVIFSGEKSYLLAVLPAIQAAIAIVNGRFKPRGLVPPTQHVDSSQLFEAVRAEGITAMA
jgi:hypothetical protein